MDELNCKVCGGHLPPNGNYLMKEGGALVHYHCDMEQKAQDKIIELETEIEMLRDLLDAKVEMCFCADEL